MFSPGDLVTRLKGHHRDATVDAATRVKSCIRDEIVPALAAVREQLVREGHDPVLETGEDWARLAVTNFNGLPLEYRVRGCVYKEPAVNLASVAGTGTEDTLKRYGRIEVHSAGRTREYRPARCGRAAVERAALRYFRRFLFDSPGG